MNWYYSEQVCSYLYNFLNVRMQLNHSWWLDKKVAKLDQTIFDLFFLFVIAIGLIYCKLDRYWTPYLYESICKFYRKSCCTEACSYLNAKDGWFVGPTREFFLHVTITHWRYANFDKYSALKVYFGCIFIQNV